MKPPNPSQDGRATPGFTLIEVLITISIIALLATLSMVAMGHATKVSNRKKTQSYLTTIALFLDHYENDNGVYPRPKEGSSGDKLSVSGTTYEVGGATTLYQALTGDGDDAIDGGDTASTGILGSTAESKVYWPEAAPKGAQHVTRENNGKWYIADGFGVPWQFKVARRFDPKNPDAFQEEKDKLHNPKTYDLWSYGGLGDPLDEKAWIKNW